MTRAGWLLRLRVAQRLVAAGRSLTYWRGRVRVIKAAIAELDEVAEEARAKAAKRARVRR